MVGSLHSWAKDLSKEAHIYLNDTLTFEGFYIDEKMEQHTKEARTRVTAYNEKDKANNKPWS